MDLPLARAPSRWWLAGSVGAAVAIVVAGWTALPAWEAYHRRPTGLAVRGTVVEVRPVEADRLPLRLRIDTGPRAGQTVAIVKPHVDRLPLKEWPRPGDQFIAAPGRSQDPTAFTIITDIRDNALVALVGLLVVLVGAIGGRVGAATLLSVAFSVWLLMQWLLPAAQAGQNPLWHVLPIGGAVCVPTLAMIGGLTRKTLAAIAGSLAGLGAAAGMALWMARQMDMTGLAIEFGPYFHLDNSYWYSRAVDRVDFGALMVAGLILSALGAVMDVAMDIASSTAELCRHNPGVGRWAVVRAGIAVGRTTVGMMILVFTFIYVGSNLAFMLACGVRKSLAGWVRLLDFEEIGVDVIRLVAAGLGLVLTIPVTAVVAAWLHRPGRPAQVRDAAGMEWRPRRAMLTALAALTIALAAWWTDRHTRRSFYEVQTSPTLKGIELSESVLGQVVGLVPPVEHLASLATRPSAAENPRRGSAQPRVQLVAIRIAQGRHAGQILVTDVPILFNPAGNIRCRVGEAIHLHVMTLGEEPPHLVVTRLPLRFRDAIGFGAALMILLVLLAGPLGIRTVLGLAGSTLLALLVYLPWLARGAPPLVTTLGFGLLVSSLVFLLLGRFDATGLAAMLGTVGGLLSAGLAALAATACLRYSGLHSTAALMLFGRQVPTSALPTQLFVATLLVGLLGLALDIAIAVAIGMRQVLSATPNLSRRALFASGLRIGRDLTGTMILTLAFATLGMELPVLYFPQVMGISAAEAINSEAGSAEILRVVIGSVGLVLTAPLTAGAAALLMTRRRLGATSPPSGAPVPEAPVWALIVGGAAVAIVVWGLIRVEPCDPDGDRLSADYAAARDRLLQETDAARLEEQAARLVEDAQYDLAIVALWRALEALEAGHGAGVDREAIRLRLASLYAHRRWFDYAVPLLTDIIRADPDNALARFYLGRSHLHVHRPDLAAEQFRKLTELEPNHVDHWCDLVYALSQMDARPEAQAALEQARRLDPNHPRVRELDREWSAPGPDPAP